MTTATMNLTNGHHYHHEETDTPPSSYDSLLQSVPSAWRPTSFHDLFELRRTFRMPLDPAVQLAVSMNRAALADNSRLQWHVVQHCSSGDGFRVLGVPIPLSLWNFADQFALLPMSLGPMSNCEARRITKTFNRRRLQRNGSVSDWAIHIKPLTIPRRTGGSQQPVEELRSLLSEERATYDRSRRQIATNGGGR